MNTHPEITAAHPGMGAILHENGTAFRVWAPNAKSVHVTADFNDWSDSAAPMTAEGDGYWYADIPGAGTGDEYRYLIDGPDGQVSRIDPYARSVTNSVGNAIVTGCDYDWEGDDFQSPPWNEMVIYELHIGTFHNPADEGDARPGTFADAVEKFDHLRRLGVNTIQIMPVMEFAGDISWGYNPAHIFAVETAYGGPEGFRDFVKSAHRAGLAVILDVVYNHFGPSDIDLWQFDGWAENDTGGIYFYGDHRAETPWGETRPDYGRGPVRRFIRDNALYWLDDYHVDGLRFDMTLYIRNIRGDEGDDNDALPDGWSLLQWLNEEIAERFPGRITIAEDLRNKAEITADVDGGGAGFGAQWDAEFVHPVREILIAENDDDRYMGAIVHALGHHYNGDPFQRVIYTESHDEVANGQARVPNEIGGDEGESNWAAQKRSALGVALVFTAPGIPMLFQGQEFLIGGYFQDTVPLDWDQSEEFGGITRLYRDLIGLRRNLPGLKGRNVDVFHVNETAKVVAFRRWDNNNDPGVIVVMNFRAEPVENYRIGLPSGGDWRLQLNTDWQGYSHAFSGHQSGNIAAEQTGYDGKPNSTTLGIGGYSALVYTCGAQN